MKITPFREYQPTLPLEPTENGRAIYAIHLKEASIEGRNAFYPNCLVWDGGQLVSPYDERVMSLNKETFYEGEYEIQPKSHFTVITEPVFFFIYNFDNYYHFIYDTLPYLVAYFKLKQTVPNLKLLIQFPNPTRTTFYKFNEDLFKLFGLYDTILHQSHYRYSSIYIANSLTHGGLSNEPPRKEVYELFKGFQIESKKPLPKKIYISRRTWIHNDKSNLGTDYTQRRRLMNEDELVEKLTERGFTEIFCENLTMIEKIQLFQQAEEVVGAIGGGMCNLLFSPPTTKVKCIVSPYFLEINRRFRFSMDHTQIDYIYDTWVDKPTDKYPLYIRVKAIVKEQERIGEIVQREEGGYWVQLSQNDVAGFNNAIDFEKVFLKHEALTPLDQGLNSPYWLNLNSVLK